MRPPPRILHASGFILCVGALLVAVLFMERHLGLAPCPLCVLDRIVVGVMALIFLLALLHNPLTTGQRIYAGVNFAFGAAGGALAVRHIQLQNLPAGEIPDCAPDLEYMLATFPPAKTLSVIFNTSGECAEIAWTFLGLSIPQQTLLLFIALSALCAAIFHTARKLRRRPPLSP